MVISYQSSVISFQRITAAVLLFLLVAPAQQPQRTPPAAGNGANSGPAKFSVTQQLVIETVTVTDKNGNPIEGLTAKDFTVTEDNVPQTIRFCEYQKLAAPPAAPVTPAPVTPTPAVSA